VHPTLSRPSKHTSAFATALALHIETRGEKFCHFVFPDTISFENQAFRKKIDFRMTRFLKKAQFKGAVFLNETDFFDATFEQPVEFNEARFQLLSGRLFGRGRL
jgi:hypothetical protein